MEPAWKEDGFEIFRVHARTDFLRKVPASLDTALRIAALNKFATLSAFVWDPGDRLSLHCSAYIHAQNAEWVKVLFLAAVAIQAADAHAKADMTAELLGGELDTSAHPESGPRPEIDDMLNVLETMFAPEGQGASPFTESDFDAALKVEPRIWISPEAEGRSLRAVLWDTPAESPTALLFASAEERHPQLGSGAFLRISIPIDGDGDEELTRRALLANMLNRMELAEWGRFHFLGSWCPDHAPEGVAFVTFLAAATYRKGLLEAMCMSMGARALWAAQRLGDALSGANLASEKLE